MQHLSGIDHVVVAVHDLDRARDAWQRMGFTVTPRGFHSLGSQNHCVMFGSDYVELLSLPRAHPAMQYYADFLAHGDGLAAVALATDDAHAAQAELVAAGIAAEAALDFSRPVALPGGTSNARFRIVQLPPAQTPGCRTFLCEHFTRDLVWRTEYKHHALGATGLAAVAMVVEDPVRGAAGWSKIFGVTPQTIDEGLRVETGSAPIAITARWKLGRRLFGVELPLRPRPLAAALFIGVADRETAAKQLHRGGFTPVALPDGSYALHAAAAGGVTLVFG